MAACSECQVELRIGARVCDHCGTRVRRSNNKKSLMIPVVSVTLIALVAYLVVLFINAISPEESIGGTVAEESPPAIKTVAGNTVDNPIAAAAKPALQGSVQQTAIPNELPGNSAFMKYNRYAYTNLNVRAGRGTEFEVLTQLKRGQPVKLDSIANGWAIAMDEDGNKIGYVFERLLRSYPIPDLEVLNWEWTVDPEFDGGEGAIMFSATVRNNTPVMKPTIKLACVTYDVNGKILDADYMFLNDVQPGGAATDSIFVTFLGREKTATLLITP